MRKVISYVVAFAMTADMVATPMNTIVRGDKIDDLKKQKQEQEQKQKNLEKKASDTKSYINEIDAKITDVSTKLGKTTTSLDKFFPGPVSRIAGMPDTAPSGAVFFIPSAIFTPLPDYAVTHRTARLTSALHTPPVPACASSRRESPFLSCH